MAQATDSRRTFVTARGRALDFSALGFGGVPLGNMFRAISDEEAAGVVEAAWATGVRYFDTAPLYGHGLSETRLGRGLASKARESFVISTKAGRLLEPCAPGDEGAGIYQGVPPLKVRFDYTRGGVLRSVEESLRRLGLDRVDILYVHDVEPRTHGSDEAYEARWAELVDGGWRALDDLRASGAVRAIGLGVNQAEPCERMLADLDPDLFLLAGRYTLLEQAPLASLMDACAAKGVGVVIGGPFNSGVLSPRGGTYNYAAAPPQVLARVARLAAVCERVGVPLAAAALQFPLAHPAVVSVIPGGQTVAEVEANAAWVKTPVPSELWAALKQEGLIDASAPVPNMETVAC